MNKKLALTLALTAAAALPQIAQAKQTMCVFDLGGAAGPVYALMKDYALAAKEWGGDLELKAYTDERVAAEDLKAGKCDGAAISGMRGRQFNSFTGSLDAVGALPDLKTAIAAMGLLAKPQLSKDMVSGDYEVVGVIPVGSAYLFVNDRSINTVAKGAGKKVAVLDYDKAQAKMAQQLGAQPISSDVTNFGSKFNNGQVDIIGAPAILFKPLELQKGLGTKGAIIHFPVTMITGNVIVRKDKFPAGYGDKSRAWIATQLPRANTIIGKDEAAIPAKYWEEIPAADKVGYVKMMRQSRIELTKEGIYNKKMMALLKKVRCQVDPSSFECTLNDE